MSNERFRVAYVPGSAQLSVEGQPKLTIDDRFVAEGASITNTGTPGVFEAGFDRDALVTFEVRVLPPESRTGRWIALIIALATAGLMGMIPPLRRRIVVTALRARGWAEEQEVRTKVVVGVVEALIVAGILSALGWLIGSLAGLW